MTAFCGCIDAEVLARCPGCFRTFCEEHDADDINPTPCRKWLSICAGCIESHENGCFRCRALKRKEAAA